MNTFNLWLESVELIDLVQEFKQSHSIQCWSSDGVKGRCDGVSKDLAHFLTDKGVTCQVIEGRGFLPDFPEDAHPHWQDFVANSKTRQRNGSYAPPNPTENKSFLGHVVVLVGKTVIDLTGAQFGNQHAKEIYTIAEFKKTWKKIIRR